MIDTGAVLIAGSQWFLYIHWFAGLHGHDGVSGMAGWRCGYIYGIHVRIVDHLLCIGIPLGYTVLNGISASMLLSAAHHSHHTRAFNIAECGSALLLGNLATAYKTPP